MGIKKTTRFLLFLTILGFSSCDENRVFDSYKSLDDAVWKRNESIAFQFSVTDTLSKHNLFFSVRNNEDYAYSNLFLISELNFPNGKKVVDTLEYEMADARGRFLGSGLSNKKESKLFYKENSVFPVRGNYQLYIHQAMRNVGEVDGVSDLKGITDVGFRIEKVE